MPRIVHKPGKPAYAPVFLQRLDDGLAKADKATDIRDIQFQCNCFATNVFNVSDYLPCGIRAALVGKDDTHAASGQMLCGTGADAPAASRYDDNAHVLLR
ncbi:hypothetical protein PPUJ21368_21130 [Pseudomonas putida]|nr:hypothetical protein PPUJ21368_21130 [Pseudomonas putida]